MKRFARMERDGLSLAPRKPAGRPQKADETMRKLLEADLLERPAATAAQRRGYLEHMTGESMSDSTVRWLMRRLGHSPQSKKRSALATERDEFLRAAWRVMVAGELCARRLVFVDEMGSNTSMHELYAYSPKGERAYCSVPRNRGKNTTLLSSMSLSGMGPSMVVEGGVNGAVFEVYLREMLVPALGKGDVMMDNLSVHKSEMVIELIEGAGAQVLYLPPSEAPPDFNPIEEAFSKIKSIVRKAGARVREALVGAIGQALSEVTKEDARTFFEHCGYREAVQLL